MAIGESIGYPIMVRPSYILGGAGTGIAADAEALIRLAAEGLDASPISEVLIERSIAGQKEFELEVMRDHADNCVVICSIENFDPMGVHTGDSITVAPAQTLTDVEYQEMRDAAFACIRRVGVETGGSNVQFAVDPRTGHQMVIEMNPRVSRSSALASKATGFPIAKIAARLAVGYRLDEITNDITGATPASFEPIIDYVVTKIPRWAFEKLPGATDVLGTRMQSVGEVMGIGRTFPESLQKAVRSLEQGRSGLNADPAEAALDDVPVDRPARSGGHRHPRAPLPARVAPAPRGVGRRPGRGHRHRPLVPVGDGQDHRRPHGPRPPGHPRGDRRRPGPAGVAPAQAARLLRRPAGPPLRRRRSTERTVRSARVAAGAAVTFKTVDTCAAEFEAHTPYHYSTTEDEDEVRPSDRPRVIILGSGPNRIGQGIEFDYCCVHASMALRDAGFETIMVNCNPETVSTDYDTSDRLYFEPLTAEDLANVIEAEQAASRGDGRLVGVIVSLGRPDPAQAGRRHRRGPGARHVAGLDRPGRGPRAVERPLRAARHPPAPGGHGHHGGRGGGRGRPDRLPGAGAPLLRAGRSGHGDRLRRRAPGRGGRGHVRGRRFARA